MTSWRESMWGAPVARSVQTASRGGAIDLWNGLHPKRRCELRPQEAEEAKKEAEQQNSEFMTMAVRDLALTDLHNDMEKRLLAYLPGRGAEGESADSIK